MPVLKRLSPEQIRRHYTHKGFLGVVPVYADMRNPDLPAITERNGIPAFVLDWQARVVQIANMLSDAVIPNFRPFDFPLYLQELET